MILARIVRHRIDEAQTSAVIQVPAWILALPLYFASTVDTALVNALRAPHEQSDDDCSGDSRFMSTLLAFDQRARPSYGI